MGKKPITVTLRTYRGKELDYNRDGSIKNDNQSVKLPYNSKSWHNFLKNIVANGYCEVEVEKIAEIEREKTDDGFKENETLIENEQIVQEVKKAFEKPEKPLTEQEKRIKMLEEKLEALTSKPKKDKNKEKEVEPELSGKDLLVEAYKEKFGKKPYHSWDEDKLKEKLAEQ